MKRAMRSTSILVGSRLQQVAGEITGYISEEPGMKLFSNSSRSVRTAAETRPVNVALLYCKKL